MSDSVFKRVAIRKYTDEKVDQEDITKLIAAFQAAPCGMHQAKDMRMTVVKDTSLLE